MKRVVRRWVNNHLTVDIPGIQRHTNISLEVQGEFRYAGGEMPRLRTLENFSTAHSVNWSSVSIKKDSNKTIGLKRA